MLPSSALWQLKDSGKTPALGLKQAEIQNPAALPVVLCKLRQTSLSSEFVSSTVKWEETCLFLNVLC